MQAINKLALTSAVAVGATIAATFPIAHAQSQIVPPRPLEHAQPAPPKNSFGVSTEGWIVVRYTVQTDGRTANVRVIDRSPPKLSEREAVSAVQAWKFEPATDNGKAIEWVNNESVVVLDDAAIPAEPSAFFLQAYREVDELIKRGEHAKALRRSERMLETETTRLIEVGLAQVQNAIVNLALNDLHAAYAAIRRASDPRIPVLATDEMKIALQYREALALQLGDAQGAVDTFARRNAIETVPAGDATGSKMAAIKEALGGDTTIMIKAKVVDGSWRHTPSRRTFGIGDLKGDLSKIHVECDRRSTELAYAPDSEWNLPASWGACNLMIEGHRDAEFVFYEFK